MIPPGSFLTEAPDASPSKAMPTCSITMPSTNSAADAEKTKPCVAAFVPSTHLLGCPSDSSLMVTQPPSLLRRGSWSIATDVTFLR